MKSAKARTVVAGIAASALLLLSIFTPAPASAATGADGWIGFNTGAAPNGHQLGTYLPSGYSQRAVCIDISSPGNYLRPPTSQSGPVTNYDPDIAYMLYTYSQVTDPAYTAALEYYVGLRINSNGPEIAAAWSQLASYSPSNFAKAQAALNDMTAQAASYGGPYSMDLGMPHAANGWTGSVSNVGPRPARSGNWPYVPYVRVDLTIIGPAVFDATGTNTLTGGSTDGWGGLGNTPTTWHATATGSIKVAETVHGLALNYTLYPAPSGNEQRMVTIAATGDMYFEDPVRALAITPTVTSHLQKQAADGSWSDTSSVLVNEKVRDTIQVINDLPNTTVALDWSAQTSDQPFSASNPSGLVIDSGTVNINIDAAGSGSALLPFTIPADYSGHVGVDTYLHGSALDGVADVDPAIFDNGESAPVIKWSPSVSSQLQKQAANGSWVDASTFMAGEKARDTIQVISGMPNATVALDWSAEKSDQPFSPTNTSGSVIVSGTVQITLDAVGAGTAVMPFTVPVGYGYVGIDTLLNGGPGNNSVDSPIFDNGEAAPFVKWSAAVSSHLQKQAADGSWGNADTFLVNQNARDTIQVVNGMPNATVSVDWSAQTAALPFSASNLVGDEFAKGTVSIALNGSGAGSAVLPFTVPVDYSGNIGVDTVLNGGLGTNDVDPTIAAAGESAPVSKWTPAVVSQLQKLQPAVDVTWVDANTFQAGDTVRDVLVITGGAPNSPVTLDWVLMTSDKAFSKTNLGIPVTFTPPESGPVTSGTGITIVLDANGSATYLLPITTGIGDGFIGVDTKLNGLAQNVDVDPAVWDANESGTVALWKPAVTTETSSLTVMSTKPISDTLKITGSRPDTEFTCSAALYGPYETQQAEQATVPADAVKAATATCSGKTDADGNATAVTAQVSTVLGKPLVPGFYVWVGTLDAMKDTAGAPVSAPITESFGVQAETSIVTVDTSGEASAGGIDGGIPANMPGGDLIWASVLCLAMIGLSITGAIRIRKVRPGPRRAYGTV